MIAVLLARRWVNWSWEERVNDKTGEANGPNPHAAQRISDSRRVMTTPHGVTMTVRCDALRTVTLTASATCCLARKVPSQGRDAARLPLMYRNYRGLNRHILMIF